MQPFFRASLAAVLLAALPIWAQQGIIRGTVTDGERRPRRYPTPI